MTPLLRQIELRRGALVVRSAAQRARISVQLAPAARRLAAADRVLAALGAHPVLAGAAAGGLALIGPGRILRWALRALPIYSLLRR